MSRRFDPTRHPLQALQDKEVHRFVQKALSEQFKLYGLSANIVKKVLAVLKKYWHDPEQAAQAVYDRVLHFPVPDPRSQFYEAYFKQYKTEGKPRFYANIIAKYLRGPIVVDVGAGPNTLALGLLSLRPNNLKKIIGTDPIDYRQVVPSDQRIEFRLQKATKIPVKDGEADTVLMISVLHHVNEQNEEVLLRDVMRILKPKGKLVIVEDSYSNRLLPKSDLFTKQFHRLTKKQKQRVMIVLDWIGTRLIPGPITMNIPYNFKTLEEWERRFQKVGFRLLRKEYLGFLKEKFTPIPQIRLILEKPAPRRPLDRV